MKLAVLTGEPSGDLIAEAGVRALRERHLDLELLGIGGEGLARAGMESRFPLREFAVNGVAEVLPHLPRLLLRIEQITRWLLRERPDMVLTVDSPDLTLRIARALRGRRYKGKLVHLVAPTVWAWKPERAGKMAAFLDEVLCLFPFEPPLFEAEGLSAHFVGHPILDRPVPAFERQPDTLLLLPGSRMTEVRPLIPLFRETVAKLIPEHPRLRCLVPTVETTRGFVIRRMADWPTPIEFLFRPEDKAAAFARSSVALAASGTVALELARAGVAGVITYRLSSATFQAIQRQTTLDHFSLINILAQAEVMPERLQHDARAELLAADLGRLLRDDTARQQQVEAQRRALGTLALPSGQTTATLIADRLETLLVGTAR